VGDLYSYGGAYDVLFNAADDVIAAGEYAPILVRPGRGRRQGFSSVVHFATFAFAGADGSELWRNVVVRDVDLKFFRTGIAQSLERVGASGSELILVGGSLVRDAGSTGTLGNGALPDFDAFVVAYDASGAEVARWSGAHAGTADGVNDELLDLAVQGPGVTNIAFGGTLEDDLGAPAFGAGYIDRQPPDVMVHLSTNQLPADGGRLNVMLEVRDNVDDEDLSASATLVGPNGSVDIPLTRVPGPAAGPATHTTALFVGSTVVPRNDLECAIGFSAVGTGTDRSGNVGMASNSLSQDGQPDVTPPMLSDCLASPPTLPPSGGGVSLGVTATDACGVQSAIAILTRPGGSQQIVPLFHGSQNRWTGTVPIPPNQTPVAERYGVRFEARDPTGNVGMLPCNDIEVLPSATGDIEPPEISDCVVGTTLLPRKGGPVSIAATVTDNVAVASVEAVIGSTDPPGEQRITLNRLTPQGDVYQGVADIGPNPTGARRSFMVTIEARDSSGNPATHPCTGFDQEGGEGKLRASEKRLSFGRIGIGNYEVRRITFRNVGDAPLQVSLQDPGAPFAVFETSNVFPGLNKRAGAASSGGMAFRLEPGEGKKFWLRFIPEKVKRYRGELRATGSGRPAQLTVPLLGEGCKGNR
jgi:hypothetical protein